MINLKKFFVRFSQPNELEVVPKTFGKSRTASKKEKRTPISSTQIIGPKESYVLSPSPKTFGEILIFLQDKNPHVMLHSLVISYYDKNDVLHLMKNDIDLDGFHCNGSGVIQFQFAKGFKEEEMEEKCFNERKRNEANSQMSFCSEESLMISKMIANEDSGFFEMIEQGKLVCFECKGNAKGVCRQCEGTGFRKLPLNIEIIRGYVDYKMNKLEEKLTRNFNEGSNPSFLKGRGVSFESKAKTGMSRLKTQPTTYSPSSLLLGSESNSSSDKSFGKMDKQEVSRSLINPEPEKGMLSARIFSSDITKSNSSHSHGSKSPARCSECKESIAFKIRYSCRTCPQYEICADCYNGKKGQKNQHVHALLPQNPKRKASSNSPHAVHSEKGTIPQNNPDSSSFRQESEKGPTRGFSVKQQDSMLIGTHLERPIVRCRVNDLYRVDLVIRNKSRNESFPPNLCLVQINWLTGMAVSRIAIPQLPPEKQIRVQITGKAPSIPGKTVSLWQFSTQELLKSRILLKEQVAISVNASY